MCHFYASGVGCEYPWALLCYVVLFLGSSAVWLGLLGGRRCVGEVGIILRRVNESQYNTKLRFFLVLSKAFLTDAHLPTRFNFTTCQAIMIEIEK